ncbi:energy-coupling factor transporter transmembrane component T [Bifidobacterium aesculapii]|uniref:energy-coupling factor transporter transmembrane component T n=1 Tax=Bifidobacterium aesculapii TaxID=1329411 RepID=UPI0006E3D723|nr:energy-coupling factor transporter transmembrane component T [Bifidobacterium aesculapii]
MRTECATDARRRADCAPAGLPSWLRGAEHYEPLPDRTSFIQRNLGHLGGVLAQVGSSLQIGRSPVDRMLCAVNPGLRLIGIVVLIVAMNMTRNMLFSYVMLAVVLVMLAARPARMIRALLPPVLAVCALSAVVALPGVFVGQYSAPVRLVVRAFVAVSMVVALARTVPWNRLMAGLRSVGCPNAVVYICDVTIQFIDILGRAMMQLLDALRLRSIGRDRTKLTSAGRLIGVLFLTANRQARRMAEAMVCRGFDGVYHVRRERLLDWRNGVYAACVAMMTALAVYAG